MRRMIKSVCFFILFNLCCLCSFAEIASGVSGTCYWVIDDDGKLTIGPLDGISGRLGLWHVSYWNPDKQKIVTDLVPWDFYSDQVISVEVKPGTIASTCSYMFYDCYNAISIDISSLDTHDVVDMSHMFAYCRKVKNLNLDNLVTSNVEDMGFMFACCNKLENLNLSNFNTGKVKTMKQMFYSCSNLESLDLGMFKTSGVQDMLAMFQGCKKLRSLNLRSFDTGQVINLRCMFSNCRRLETLDLSNFRINKQADTTEMFELNISFTPNDSLKILTLSGDFYSTAMNLPKQILAEAKPDGTIYSSAAELLEANHANGGGTYTSTRNLVARELEFPLKWGTLCYPAAITLPEGIKAYRAVGVGEDDVIELDEIKSVIPAFTPVILNSENGTPLTLPDAVATSFSGPVHEDGNMLVGCNGAFELNASNQYVMQNHDGEVGFYYVDPDTPMQTADWRAFIQYEGKTSNARLRLFADEGETVIRNVEVNSPNADTYSLSGTKVSSVRRGNVYVRGGKKAYAK